jgi:hypothetical protein
MLQSRSNVGVTLTVVVEACFPDTPFIETLMEDDIPPDSGQSHHQSPLVFFNSILVYDSSPDCADLPCARPAFFDRGPSIPGVDWRRI